MFVIIVDIISIDLLEKTVAATDFTYFWIVTSRLNRYVISIITMQPINE